MFFAWRLLPDTVNHLAVTVTTQAYIHKELQPKNTIIV